MKVNYLSYDDRFRHKSLSPNTSGQESMCRESVILCDESGVSKNNGSNMRKTNVAAINFKGTISKFIFKNKLFNSMLTAFEANTAISQNGVALGVAGVLRPLTNIAMSTKEDREDCAHAATHAFSSAIVGFGISGVVMQPVSAGVKRFKDDPAKYLHESMAKFYGIEELGARKVQTSKIFKNTCKMAEMLPEILIGVPKALITIALIPPILKYVFGIENKKQAKIEELPKQAKIETPQEKEVA